MGYNDRSEKQQEFVMNYFGSLREEIHLRLRDHTRLVWIKLIVLGAMYSFIITEFNNKPNTSPEILFLLWGGPIAAAIFDALIAGNLEVIANIGFYNKEFMEKMAFGDIANQISPEFGLWEETIAQSGTWICYAVKDISMMDDYIGDVGVEYNPMVE